MLMTKYWENYADSYCVGREAADQALRDPDGKLMPI